MSVDKRKKENHAIGKMSKILDPYPMDIVF